MQHANSGFYPDYRLSRFTGDYSEEIKQQWTAGDIVLERIYRFKGSQRPFILLIDADFAKVNLKDTRLFYVSMTRDTLGLELFFDGEMRKGIKRQSGRSPINSG